MINTLIIDSKVSEKQKLDRELCVYLQLYIRVCVCHERWRPAGLNNTDSSSWSLRALAPTNDTIRIGFHKCHDVNVSCCKSSCKISNPFNLLSETLLFHGLHWLPCQVHFRRGVSFHFWQADFWEMNPKKLLLVWVLHAGDCKNPSMPCIVLIP